MNAIIILPNTIIDREARLILERDPKTMDTVRLYMSGVSEPHIFEGSDARDLWRAYDDRAPEWK